MSNETRAASAARTREESPIVKICGITNIDDALHAIECGADALGFNFFSGSPRYIRPDAAAVIIRQLPESVTPIGVFVNEPLDGIVEMVGLTRISAIQLHGEEPSQFAAELGARTGLDVIKAVRLRPGDDPEAVPPFGFGANVLLLDTYSEGERGGTGKTIDWELAYQFAVIHWPVYLAGGLSADNVREAIRKVRPFGVDACSRLESSPGKKDPKKVEAFIYNAKNA